MSGANVPNADVSKQIHWEIVVVAMVSVDDVENHSEFGRQMKISDELRGVRDRVSMDFDGGDESAAPSISEVVKKRDSLDAKSEANALSSTLPP